MKSITRLLIVLLILALAAFIIVLLK